MQTIAREVVMEWKALLSRLEEFEKIAARIAKQKRGGLENRSIEQRDCKRFEPLRERGAH